MYHNCIHAENTIRGLGGYFNVERRDSIKEESWAALEGLLRDSMEDIGECEDEDIYIIQNI